MIDQATELRQLVLAEQSARPRPVVRRVRASAVTVVGGSPGVGASTVATNLTIAFQQAGSDMRVIDGGCLDAADDLPIAPDGETLLLVIGPEQSSITGAYAAMKGYRAAGVEMEYFVLGNQARLADLVYADRLERSLQRLVESAQTFLDVRITSLGSITHSIQLESYRGDRGQWIRPTIASAENGHGADSSAARRFAHIAKQLLEKN